MPSPCQLRLKASQVLTARYGGENFRDPGPIGAGFARAVGAMRMVGEGTHSSVSSTSREVAVRAARAARSDFQPCQTPPPTLCSFSARSYHIDYINDMNYINYTYPI